MEARICSWRKKPTIKLVVFRFFVCLIVISTAEEKSPFCPQFKHIIKSEELSWSLGASHEACFEIWDIICTLASWALHFASFNWNKSFQPFWILEKVGVQLHAVAGWWCGLRNTWLWGRKKEGSGTAFPGRSSSPCHRLCTAAGDAASWTTHPYRGTKCCLARHDQPGLCLARLSADCSMLSPRAPCFSSGRVKVPPSAHSPLPTTQPPVFTCFCWLSVSLLGLLSGKIFLFLPRARFSQMILALPPLSAQKEKGPLWYEKLWCSCGEDPVCSEMAAESVDKLGRADLSYWERLQNPSPGFSGHPRRGTVPGCISVKWNVCAWATSLTI